MKTREIIFIKVLTLFIIGTGFRGIDKELNTSVSNNSYVDVKKSINVICNSKSDNINSTKNKKIHLIYKNTKLKCKSDSLENTNLLEPIYKMVYTIGLSNGLLPEIQTNATVLVNNSTSFLNDAVNKAIEKGYKKIYIQEGVYLMKGSINIKGKYGIVLEGAGSGTILKPSTSILLNMPLINVSDGASYCVVRNLSFEPHDINTNAKVDTCIRLGSACDKNTFENLMIGRQVGGTFTYSNKPIFIDLPSGEADFNTFQNITFKKCIGGIYIKATDGVFNENLFQNISFDKSKVGIEFEGNGANDNMFSNIKLQISVNNDGLINEFMSTHAIKNVGGSNNTFRDIFIADWNAATNSNLQYVINTIPPSNPTLFYTGAYRTVIENVEVEGDGYNGKPFTFVKYYQDLGTSTQFINNAMGNRNTDYIFNNVNNINFLGQEQNGYLNNFNVEKMNRTYFSGRENLDGTNSSFYAVEKFNNLFLGHPTTVNNTYLRGASILVNIGSTSPLNNQVLAADGTTGKLKWKNTLNLYESNGNIDGNLIDPNSGTVSSSEANNTTRDIRLQSNNNYRNVRFTTNGNSEKDILFLHSNASNINNKVVIGSNGNSVANNQYNSGFKLLVNGKLKVKDEILILSTTSHWADYVFNANYKLKTLSEVERFIKEKGRLPNMPSAIEIETNGLPLSEITTKQQEKIEELTLYVIQQEKRIIKQEKELEILKNIVLKLTSKK